MTQLVVEGGALKEGNKWAKDKRNAFCLLRSQKITKFAAHNSK